MPSVNINETDTHDYVPDGADGGGEITIDDVVENPEGVTARLVDPDGNPVDAPVTVHEDGTVTIGNAGQLLLGEYTIIYEFVDQPIHRSPVRIVAAGVEPPAPQPMETTAPNVPAIIAGVVGGIGFLGLIGWALTHFPAPVTQQPTDVVPTPPAEPEPPVVPVEPQVQPGQALAMTGPQLLMAAGGVGALLILLGGLALPVRRKRG